MSEAVSARVLARSPVRFVPPPLDDAVPGPPPPGAHIPVPGPFWVSGRLEVRPGFVHIAADYRRRATHRGAREFGVIPREITAIVVVRGVLTPIVRLDGRWGSIWFRCSAARRIAAIIEQERIAPTGIAGR